MNRKKKIPGYKEYLFIGMGGFAGAILRFYCNQSAWLGDNSQFFNSTLLVNLLGCFLLGLFLTCAAELWDTGPELKLGVATGFLGALTTFSTFCKDFVLLIDQHAYLAAVSYLMESVLLGLMMVFLGIVIAGKLIKLVTKSVPGRSVVIAEPEQEEA